MVWGRSPTSFFWVRMPGSPISCWLLLEAPDSYWIFSSGTWGCHWETPFFFSSFFFKTQPMCDSTIFMTVFLFSAYCLPLNLLNSTGSYHALLRILQAYLVHVLTPHISPRGKSGPVISFLEGPQSQGSGVICPRSHRSRTRPSGVLTASLSGCLLIARPKWCHFPGQVMNRLDFHYRNVVG